MNDINTLDNVLRSIREVAGVSLEDLKGRSRKRDVVFCRFVAAKELYGRTTMSMTDISELMNRDIKSISYYLTRYNEDYKSFAKFRKLADKVREQVD